MVARGQPKPQREGKTGGGGTDAFQEITPRLPHWSTASLDSIRSSPSPTLTPGTLLAGRYRIAILLGRGGMGEVYRAWDLKLEQDVALKFLLTASEPSEAQLTRFLEEVKIARRLTHPNLCRVFDLGEADGRPFLTMEWIEGEDLGRFLRRAGPLERSRALRLCRQSAEALASIHAQGVLHGDIKPSNLMVDSQGDIKITDFGLATLAAEEAHPPNLGTPAYLAPERRAGGGHSKASDLYAMGLVLHRILGLATPEEKGMATDGNVESPPDTMVRLFGRCLSPDPLLRPSAPDLAAALAPDEGARAAWRPSPEAEVPARPQWILTTELDAGGFGQAWLARHRKSEEKRVFKFCFDPAKLPALRREVTVWRLLRQSLGEREDINRILDWSLDEPPYFLESDYSAGGSLATYCAARGGVKALPLELRLELAAQVAEALAAAHEVGVLHKDVKPANVLIQEGGESPPRARLGDFGLGTVLDEGRLQAAGITVAALTNAGEADSHQGTYLYLAPELLEGRPATVRSDIYALGVLLFQLVSGDLSRALAPGWERHVESELLRADIARAVAGAPEERYASARPLADRLRRLRERRQQQEEKRAEEEQAEAERASLARARRRLRWTALAAGTLLLLGGALAFHARSVAREAEGTQRMLDFMVGLFDAPDADMVVPETLTVREILDRGAARIELDFHERPEIGARLHHTLGMAYHTLGMRARGAELLGKALGVQIRQHGKDSILVADTSHELAALLNDIGRSEEAEPHIRRALASRIRHFGKDSLPVADSQQVLAGVLFYNGLVEEPLRLYREVLELYRALRPEGHPDTAIALRNLGMAYSRHGRLKEAHAHLKDALALIRRIYPDDHPETALTLMILGLALQRSEDLENAEASFQEALTIKRRLVGADHPDTIAAMTYLGLLFKKQGRTEDARRLLQQALDLHPQRYGEQNSATDFLNKTLAELASPNPNPTESKSKEGV